MAYRKFDTGTWQDPWFEDLSPKAKLAFIYLWTNEICNQAGIYEISRKRMKFELGYDIDTIYKEIQAKVEWYPEKNIIWIKNFFRRQCQNGKFAKAALDGIKSNPFKLGLFLQYNVKFMSKFKVNLNPYFDTVSIPYPTEADTEAEAEADTEDESTGVDSCPEPQGDPSPPSILAIPLIERDGEFQIYQADIDQWQDTFPGVDVASTMKIIRQWSIDNPAKRKTKSGIRQHISTWLGKEQNKSPQRPRGAVNGGGRSEQNAHACNEFVHG